MEKFAVVTGIVGFILLVVYAIRKASYESYMSQAAGEFMSGGFEAMAMRHRQEIENPGSTPKEPAKFWLILGLLLLLGGIGWFIWIKYR